MQIKEEILEWFTNNGGCYSIEQLEKQFPHLHRDNIQSACISLGMKSELVRTDKKIRKSGLVKPHYEYNNFFKATGAFLQA